jgi:diacylglycerol O-acyltransferase / wax synthase
VDRLSPQDAAFLHIENDVNHMHIGSVAVFEGPVPAYAELEAMVAGKLPLAGRYRQRVRQVPLQLGRPVWVDDPHFRLGYHLRHTALPRPGGRDQLRDLVGRAMSQPLDRSKPLWELWLVEGLDDGHWALFTKVHHCMVDGIAGTELLTVLLDDTPEPSSPVPDRWRAAPEPSGLRLAGDALIDYVASPYEQWRAARVAASAPLRIGRLLADTAGGLATVPGLARVPPASSLAGPIGPHRRWGWTRASLEEVRAVRTCLGGTVNDVVLAVVTRAFRDLILAHGESPDQTPIRSLVPVSVRRSGEHGSYNNRVSAMLAELPVAVVDPVERLDAVRRQMEGLKESRQAVAAETLTSLSGFAPPLLLALGTRVATRALGRFGRGVVNTVTTNVPGPRHPLYALGRRLVEACPYVPLVSPMRVGVAVFSYDGNLAFGVTADDTVPDVEVFCDGIEAGMTELLKVAEGSGNTGGRGQRPSTSAARRSMDPGWRSRRRVDS